MNLSPHFTLREFTDSDTAERRRIDNSLPEHLLPVAISTARMAERIRHHLSFLKKSDVRMQITSGYRSPSLNEIIGSKPTSDHIKMLALDFKAPDFGTPLDICRALVPVMDELGIGQLIHEHTWVHVSARSPDNSINKVITANGRGFVPGIREA
jgi:uncharacterized protein YcbK (DUF882 family)